MTFEKDGSDTFAHRISVRDLISQLKGTAVSKANPSFPPFACSQSIVMLSEMGRKQEISIPKLNWNLGQAANVRMSHQKVWELFAIYQRRRRLEWKSAKNK